MRTTLDVADDVLSAARAVARRRKVSLGRAISDLARIGLTADRGEGRVADAPESFYGFSPLPRRADVVVTDDLVDELRDDET